MLKGSILKTEDTSSIKKLLTNYSFKSYRQVLNLNNKKLTEYIHKELIENKDKTIVVKDADKIVGLSSLEEPLDPLFFGKKMAGIKFLLSKNDDLKIKEFLISFLLNKCKVNDIKYLYIRVFLEDLSTVHLLEKFGFKLMEVMEVYFLDFKNKELNTKTNFMITEYKKSDLPYLKKIANSCFRKTRFHLDKLLSKKADKLYIFLVEKASLDNSTKIFVAREKNKPVGFIICKIDNKFNEGVGKKFGVIELVGVDNKMQKRGIGNDLVKASLKFFSENVDIAEVSTQANNFPAKKIYLKNKFDSKLLLLTFHKWL